jgi:uncharacterized protein YecE (DUF72 family)
LKTWQEFLLVLSAKTENIDFWLNHRVGILSFRAVGEESVRMQGNRIPLRFDDANTHETGRVGCSGFTEARAKYFQEFRSVEVQQTFYEPPKPETVARWRAEAGPGFHFALKAWQTITHDPSSPTYRRLRTPFSGRALERLGWFRPTEEVNAAWGRTAEVACALNAEVVLFQCPASFRPSQENIHNLTNFFARVERHGLQFAWEPRGVWPTAQVTALCRDLSLIHAIDPFVTTPSPGGLYYFRLHGIGGARYRYTSADLNELAKWAKPGSGCVYFNNLAMLEDVRQFQRLILSHA